MAEFMEYKNNTVYQDDKWFTHEELLSITPEDIRKWMSFRVFGTEDPDPNADQIYYRSETIKCWKRSISSFMPNDIPWTTDPTGRGTGNPTKSPIIVEFLESVTQIEKRIPRGKKGPKPRETVEENNDTWRASLYARVASLDAAVTKLQKDQHARFAELKKENKELLRLVRTLLPRSPAKRGPARIRKVAREATAETEKGVAGPSRKDPRPALLCNAPKTLSDLWKEYQNGIGGNKPARLFTEKERANIANGVKHKYHDRKVIWKCMERLILAGCTKQQAIDQIVGVYGSITKPVLRAMRQDEQNGGHILLREKVDNTAGLPRADPRPALLCKTPRTLSVLWDEYQNGIGGNKPARLFTPRERGNTANGVKHKYHDRKVIWKCMERLIRAGCTEQEAIHQIVGVYGDITITNLVRAMRPHENNGGHARLRV